MTEDEATKLACCGPRNGAAENTDGDILCIGSTCMAWQWDEAKRTAAFLEAVQADMQASAKPNFNASVQAVYAEKGGQFERVEGYCGLAR